MEDQVMTSEVTEAQEAPQAENSEFAAIRERFEAGEELSDADVDKIADTAITFVRKLLSFFGETHIAVDEYEGDEGELILDVSGNDLAVLIGRHGRTLDSLQMVVSAYLSNELHFHYPIVVDIEGYKGRRKEKVTNLALSAAARAKRQKGSVSMAPMNAYERRLVHIALVGDESVSTHSEGEDPDRHVVVTYVR